MSSKQILTPGQTFNGFSMFTCTQSGQGTDYAQSVAVIPSVDDANNYELRGYELLPFQKDSYTSMILAPVVSIYDENWPPSVNGVIDIH